MSHGTSPRSPDQLDAGFVDVLADTMQALAAPSRVRILGQLHAGSCAVGELAAAVDMEASAVSHQLRLLRHLGLVAGSREGRSVVYSLHDEHVGQLLEEAISHVEHLYLARAETSSAALAASA